MNMNLRTRHLAWILGMALLLLLPLLLACEGQTATTEEADSATPAPNQEASDPSSPRSDQGASAGSSSTQTGESEPGREQGSGAGPTPSPTPRPEFPAEAVNGDYDHDDDGLLEIRTLAQLDAMRLDPEGTGFVQDGRDQYFAAFPGTGGPLRLPQPDLRRIRAGQRPGLRHQRRRRGR